MNAAPKEWKEQGCPTCRAGWESGSRVALRNIGTSYELHTRLFQCAQCGAYWEELERYAQEVSASDAALFEQHKSFVPNAGSQETHSK